MSNLEKILKRIAASVGNSDLVATLADKLNPTDLQSLLLAVFDARAKKLNVSDVYHQYQTNRFVAPSSVSPRRMLEADAIAFSMLPDGFEPLELSPVTCFGLNSTLAHVNQKTILSTIRNVETIADPTTALALGCSQRRAETLLRDPLSTAEIKLAVSHRILRLQDFSGIDGFTPHFRAFALASAGRDVGHETFYKKHLNEHVCFYLDVIQQLCGKKYAAANLKVALSDIRIADMLIELQGLPRQDITHNTQVSSFNLFMECGISHMAEVSSISETKQELTKIDGLKKPLELLRIIEGSTVKKLQKQYPDVHFTFDLHRIAGIGYYQNLCFKITAENKNGTIFPLVDGGCSDWTQKLLNSRKERILTSGFGTELFCEQFKA